LYTYFCKQKYSHLAHCGTDDDETANDHDTDSTAARVPQILVPVCFLIVQRLTPQQQLPSCTNQTDVPKRYMTDTLFLYQRIYILCRRLPMPLMIPPALLPTILSFCQKVSPFLPSPRRIHLHCHGILLVVFSNRRPCRAPPAQISHLWFHQTTFFLYHTTGHCTSCKFSSTPIANSKKMLWSIQTTSEIKYLIRFHL
jgi:hypothetical protein